MIFTFLISIVFIAELIIAISIILNVVRLDKALLSFNQTLNLAKPSINEVCILMRRISSQLKELSFRYVQKVKQEREELLAKNLLKLLSGILLWKLNIRIIKKLRKSKLVRTLGKGLSLLQIVV